MNRAFAILFILILCQACTPAKESAEFRVFVAASLSPVVTAIASKFEEQKNVRILINSASSGTLARQIEQGASADLFISANRQWIKLLRNKQLIKAERTLSAKNQLVLIVPTSSMIESINLSNPGQWNNFLTKSRLAIGDPNHVPVGQYAMQAIEALNWQLVPQQTLQTKDARSTLVAVEFGEADLGIVYQTDAEKSEKVKIIASLPEEAYEPIHYFAGTCSNNPLTADFLSFMNTTEVRQIWEKHGFGF